MATMKKLPFHYLFLIVPFVATFSAFAQTDSVGFVRDIAALEDNMWVNYARELPNAQQLHQRVIKGSCKSCEAKSVKLLGKFYWANGEYDKGLLLLKQASALAFASNDRETLASSLDLIGNTFYYQAYYDSALYYFNRALRVYEEQRNLQGQITVLHNTSLMYHRKGDFSKTIEFLFREEQLKDQLPGSVYEIEAMGAMGSLMVDSIYYHEEIQDERKALLKYRQANDKKSMYRTYRNIGKAYRQLEEFTLAARNFLKSSVIMEELGMVPEWDLVATDFRDANNPDSCFYFHYKAKADFYRMTQPNISYTLELLGDAHRYFKNFDSARFYYDSAMQMNIRMNNRITFTGIHRYLVGVHTALGNYHAAEKHLLTGLELAKEVALIHEMNLYREGKLLYEKKGDFKKALWFSEKYRVYLDSINRAETALNLTRMQAQFKTAKKEREVEDLQQANLLDKAQLKTRNLQMALAATLILVLASIGALYFSRYRQKARTNQLLESQKKVIENQNRELEKQNKNKEILLSEIHHRVKNNLQIISSLINLKSRQATSDTKEILSQLNGRIFSMGLLHEKLYKNENLQSIRLDLYLAELTRYLLDSFQESEAVVKLELGGDKVEISIDHALTCGLICNELFTNSMKYAFAEDQSDRSIRVSVKKSGGHIELGLSDNGRRIKSLPENFRKSFGLRFVDQLVTSKLRGTWSYRVENGFNTSIRLPHSANGKN